MTALATRIAREAGGLAEPPVPQAERSEQRLFESDGPTLEDLVLGVWEELVADGAAAVVSHPREVLPLVVDEPHDARTSPG